MPEGDDVVAADADATVAGTAPDAQKRCPFQEDELPIFEINEIELSQ